MGLVNSAQDLGLDTNTRRVCYPNAHSRKRGPSSLLIKALGSPPPKEVDQMNDYKQSCVLIKIEMIENI